MMALRYSKKVSLESANDFLVFSLREKKNQFIDRMD